MKNVSEGYKQLLSFRIRKLFAPIEMELQYNNDTVIINVVSAWFTSTTQEQRYSFIVPLVKELEKIFRVSYNYEIGLYAPGENYEPRDSQKDFSGKH